MRRFGWICLVAALFVAGCSSMPTIKLPFVAPTATATLPRQTTTSACPPAPALMDDRSTATNLILSFFNALDREEYTRAFEYLSPPSTTPITTNSPGYATWYQGYANTACDIVTYHGAETAVTSNTPGWVGIGAGVVVPLTLTAINWDGTLQQFAGTYLVRYDPKLTLATAGYLDVAHSQFSFIG